jgi:alcohol dehydrogenase
MAQREVSAVLEDTRKISLKEFAIPQIGPNVGLLKVEMVGICGSDVAYYKGKLKPFALPLIMGHETVGFIEEIGSEAEKDWGVSKGDRVVVEASIRCGECRYCVTGNYRHCRNQFNYGHHVSCDRPPHLWGSYGQYMYLSPGSLVHKISRDVSAKAAVLVNAVIANGIQWLNRIAGIRLGDTVVIQGAGPQGLANVIAARESGASPIIVTGLGADEQRGCFALAREFGADYTVNVEAEDPIKLVSELTDGAMADIVVDVTGSPDAVLRSVELVGRMGTLILAGLAGPETVTPLVTDKLVWKEVRLQGVVSKGVEAVLAAIRLVESGRYPLEKMVTHTFSLPDAEKGLQAAGGELEGTYPIKTTLVP